MRIAFAGTPAFAAAALSALHEAGHEIVLVLTQPDRPSGRGMKLHPSAVKTVAVSLGLPVLTPVTLSVKKSPEEAEEALKALENCGCDVFVVAAYGLILPQRALDAAKGIGADGTIRNINIHASLLPRWRGAAPITRAIESQDAQTGITLMKMDAGLDTGDMIESRAVEITATDTSETLTEKLTQLGARMITDALSRPAGLMAAAQPAEGVTYAHKILKSESPVDWTKSAEEIAARIRAFCPFPGSTAQRNGETFKIWFAGVCSGQGRPGEVLSCSADGVVIACGSGAVRCTRLQRPGKPAVAAQAFIQSSGIQPGEVLASTTPD